MVRLKIVFMGTPDFAVPALEAVSEAGHQLVAVYSQPPRPAGRGHAPRPGPVQRAAESRGLALRTPATLKDAGVQQDFAALGADVAVVAAYGLILPRPVLAAPGLGCLNIHASLLPRWRGAAPIQRAIMACDQTTGVTIMQMDEGLDTGPILLQRAIAIGAMDAGAVHDRLSALGAEAIVAALDQLAQGRLTPRPQPATGITYAAKLSRADEAIDWRRSADDILCQIRALAPRPGASFELDGETWKLLTAQAETLATTTRPGRVLDRYLTIACGAGALRALVVQRPGRKPMAAAELLRGRAVPAGTILH